MIYAMSVGLIVEKFQGGHGATRSFRTILDEAFSYGPTCRRVGVRVN